MRSVAIMLVFWAALLLRQVEAASVNVAMPSRWELSSSTFVVKEIQERNDYYCKCYNRLDKCVKAVKEYAAKNPKDKKVTDWVSRLKKIAKNYGWKHYKSGEPARVPIGKIALDGIMKDLGLIEIEMAPFKPNVIGQPRVDAVTNRGEVFLVNGLPVGTIVLSRDGNDYTCRLPDGSTKVVHSDVPITAPGIEVGLVSGAVKPGQTIFYGDPEKGLKSYTVPDTRTHREKKQDLRNERMDQAVQALQDINNGWDPNISEDDAGRIIQNQGGL